MRLKFLAFVLVSALLLTGCSTPESEFEKSYGEAQLSLEQGDIEAAKAQISTALESLPDSEEGKLFALRIEFLEQIRTDASKGSWLMALNALGELGNDGFERALGIKLAFEGLDSFLSGLNLTSGTVAEKSAAAFTVESLVYAVQKIPEAESFVDRPNITALINDAQKARIAEIESLLEASAFKAGLMLIIKLEALPTYSTSTFSELRLKAETLFEQQSIELVNKEIKIGNLPPALAAVEDVLFFLPDSAALIALRVGVEDLIAEEKKRAIAAMFVQEDSFEGVTTYHDRATYTRNPANKFELSIDSFESSPPRLNLRLMMLASDWVFFELAVIDVDGQKYFFAFDYYDIERDNSCCSVWEWHDLRPSAEDLEMIQEIIASKSSRIRYYRGDEQEFVERPISSSQKQALKNVLLVFKSLGGDLENPS